MNRINEDLKKLVVKRYLNGEMATRLIRELFPHKKVNNFRHNIYNWIKKYAPNQARFQDLKQKLLISRNKYTIKTKINYVMRYLQGESAMLLAKQLWPYKDPYDTRSFVRRWHKELIKKEIIPSCFIRKKMPKIISYKKLSKAKLIEIINLKDQYYKFIEKEKQKKFEFIAQIKSGYFPNAMLCNIFNVSLSGYYKYKNRKSNNSQDNDLIKLIKMLFYKHKQNIGYRKMVYYVYKEIGIKYNHKKIYRIMKNNSLKATIRNKWSNLSNEKISQPFPYLINRNFVSSKPLLKFLTDVTTIKLSDFRNAYLSPIMDLFNREIISFEFMTKNNKDLIVNQLKNLVKRLDSDKKPIINSDHGSIYFSDEYQKLANKHFQISMSRLGNCLDNQPIEYFFSIIKQECIKKIPFQKRTFKKLKFEIISFINYYNESRIQSSLKYMSPYEYKNQFK